jgi:hypothetical protein
MDLAKLVVDVILYQEVAGSDIVSGRRLDRL